MFFPPVPILTRQYTVRFEIVTQTMVTKKKRGSVFDGKHAVCGFLLPVSVRVWRDEGLLTRGFSPLCLKEKQLCNFWWSLSSSCIFPDNSDKLFNSTVKAWENWSHNIFFCFWASITIIVAESFCQWAQFYTLLWFRIHPSCCSTSPSQKCSSVSISSCSRSRCLFFESTCAACKHLNEEVLRQKGK